MSRVIADLQDPLIGLRVQVVIEEDGNQTPARLPPGTIIKRIRGTDNKEYCIVNLEHSVKTIRAKTKEEWDLREVALRPHFGGVSMDRLLSPPEAGFDFVHVRIIRPVYTVQEREILDISKSVYFALGTVRTIGKTV